MSSYTPGRKIVPNDFYLNELGQEDKFPDFYQGASGSNAVEKNLDPEYGTKRDIETPDQSQSYPSMLWDEMKKSVVDPTLNALSLPYKGINQLSKMGAEAFGLHPKDDYDVAQTLGNLAIPQDNEPLGQFGPLAGLRDNPTLKGIVKGGVTGAARLGLDPLTYTGLGALEEAPVLSKVAAAGFSGMAGKSAYDKFKESGNENLSDEEKAALRTEGVVDLAGAGLGAAHLVGHENLAKIPDLLEKGTEKLPLQWNVDAGMFGGNIKPKYKGQEVDIVGRRGNTVRIKLPDGSESKVGFSELDRGNQAQVEGKIGPYEHLTPEEQIDLVGKGQKPSFYLDSDAETINKLQKLAQSKNLPHQASELPEGSYDLMEIELPKDASKEISDYNIKHMESMGAINVTREGNLIKGTYPKAELGSRHIFVGKDQLSLDALKAGKTSREIGKALGYSEADIRKFENQPQESKTTYTDLIKELSDLLGEESPSESLVKYEGKTSEPDFVPGRTTKLNPEETPVIRRPPSGGRVVRSFADLVGKDLSPENLEKLTYDVSQEEHQKISNENLAESNTKFQSEVDAINKRNEQMRAYKAKNNEALRRAGLKETPIGTDEEPFVEGTEVKPQELSSFARIDGKQVELSPEQKTAWDKANEDYQQSLRIANQKFSDPEYAAKQKKTAGIKFSIAKREILGQKSVRSGGPVRIGSSLEDAPFLSDEDVSLITEPLAEEKQIPTIKPIQGELVKSGFQGPIKPIKEGGGKGNKPPNKPPSGGLGGPPETPPNELLGSEGKNRPQGSEWLLDAWRAPGSMKYALDMPALSHSLTDTLAHPIKSLGEIKESAHAAVSPEHYKEILKGISERPNFVNEVDQKSGLHYSRQGYDPNAQNFGSYIGEKIPGVKASERMQNTILDLKRARIFDDLTRDFGSYDKNPEMYKRAADLANVSTGYGKFDNRYAEGLVKVLNQFGSARLQVSRLKHIGMMMESLAPNGILPEGAKLPDSVRTELWKQAGSTLTVGVGLLKLAQMAGAKVSTDPRDSNFAKAIWAKPDGNKVVYSPFSSYQPVVRFLTQMSTGKKVIDGKVKSLREAKSLYDPNIGDEVGEYTHNRLHPSTRTAYDLFTKNDTPKSQRRMNQLKSSFLDKKNPLSIPAGMVEPINIGVLKDLYDELGPAGVIGNVIPLTLGANIDVYKKNLRNVSPLGTDLNPMRRR